MKRLVYVLLLFGAMAVLALSAINIYRWVVYDRVTGQVELLQISAEDGTSGQAKQLSYTYKETAYEALLDNNTLKEGSLELLIDPSQPDRYYDAPGISNFFGLGVMTVFGAGLVYVANLSLSGKMGITTKPAKTK